MSQLPLFASSGQVVLVDDSRGRIVYTPDIVSPEVARAWFGELLGAVPWKAQRRRMYERDVDVPRLTAHFWLAPENDVPQAIRAATTTVVNLTGVPFNSVGLNFYRDGQDSVAPHTDHLHEIVAGFPIALLSLGDTRRMAIRAKEPPRRAFNVDLVAGSVFVMSYETQLHYTHAIPKITTAVGPRISLAFRVKPTDDSTAPTSFYR